MGDYGGIYCEEGGRGGWVGRCGHLGRWGDREGVTGEAFRITDRLVSREGGREEGGEGEWEMGVTGEV